MQITDLNDSSEQYISQDLARAVANPLFPQIDSQLRSGRHISNDDFQAHSYLADAYDALEHFYRRYQVELIKAPEGFFYLRPKSNALLGRSMLSELDMLVGKVLCYLYLSPERLANEGVFSLLELLEELSNLADETQLLRMVNQRSGGSDLDKQKLKEKVKGCLRRFRRLGMVTLIGGVDKFSLNEAIFRFGADVRTDEDPREVQLRLIREGEAIVHDDDMPTDEKLQQADDADSDNEEQLGLEV